MGTDTYDTYLGATQRAKFLASTFQTAVQVRAANPCWTVVLPDNYRPELDTMGRSARPVEDDREAIEPLHDNDVFDDDGERALLTEELEADRDNWARSDDDGWFYPD